MPELPITLSVLVIPIGLLRAVGATLALAVGVACLLRGRRAIWQTTLKSAWWWSLAALLAWSLVECAIGVWPAFSGGTTGSALRLIAISLSLCPAIALLGAKRPQDGPWNLVVLALWVVLALPAMEALFLRPGQQLNLGVLRGGFLTAPVLLLLMNYGGTRYWRAASIFTAAQVIAWSSAWWPVTRSIDVRSLLGLLGVSTAIAVAYHSASRPAENQRDRLWIDFRDTLGAFWALRVAERMNATALQQGWNLELTWNGVRPSDPEQPTPGSESNLPTPAVNTLRGLLRRFVSNKWIDQRLYNPTALLPPVQSGP